jgi:aminoglycoside phosphotransferase
VRFDDALGLLPPGWQAALSGCAARPAAGLGGASVFLLPNGAHGRRYLKIACGAGAQPLADEIARTEWLASRHVRVPEFLMKTSTGGVTAVLMTAVPGRKPAPGARDPLAMARAIGHGLARLHALPAVDCPFDEMPRTRLARARAAIDRNEIDGSDFDDRNAGVTPEALYRRLAATVPAPEDVVVVHGDATLENMLISQVGESGFGELGFIDCSDAGRSDRYVDLAVAEMNLREDFGPEAADAFKAACGVRHWDSRKAAYFADLYELF